MEGYRIGKEMYTEDEWNDLVKDLDEEEREIFDAFHRGELVSDTDSDKNIEAVREAARNTLRRTHRVTLRLSEADMIAVRHLVEKENVPCSTLLYEIIHEYLRGHLIERKTVAEGSRMHTLPPAR